MGPGPVPNGEPSLSRRRFLTAGVAGAGALLGAAARPHLPGAWAAPPAGLPGSAFTLGVASGEPRPDRVVLWTRLAPEPLAGGGMPPTPVPVRYEVAADDAFRQIVRTGAVLAEPDHAHSVHVEVTGLAPGRWYWYRFATVDEASPAGRTRTAPAAGSLPDGLRFAFASCQQYEHGYFTAYRRMAAEDLDLVVHLGDYVYESATDAYMAPGGNVRHHVGLETATLEDYRRRFAQYRTDPDLQAAHAAFPWVVTWDDHEVENNYAGDISSRPAEPQPLFHARLAAAYQAYWEHMPLPPSWAGMGAGLRLYRRLAFGRLAELNVLDTRQYRSDQPCGDKSPGDCPGRRAPGQTITGPEQERWLLDGLAASQARWNVLANQVFLSQLDMQAGPGRGYYMDGWDGYVASRDRLLAALARRGDLNPVVLTGDFHSNWMADLKADFDDPASATLGTEFVGTSITSGGDGSDTTPFGRSALADNPHLHFYNAQRGYVRCTVTPQRWTADYRVLPYVKKPGAPVATRASFTIEAGRPGAV